MQSRLIAGYAALLLLNVGPVLSGCAQSDPVEAYCGSLRDYASDKVDPGKIENTLRQWLIKTNAIAVDQSACLKDAVLGLGLDPEMKAAFDTCMEQTPCNEQEPPYPEWPSLGFNHCTNDLSTLCEEVTRYFGDVGKWVKWHLEKLQMEIPCYEMAICQEHGEEGMANCDELRRCTALIPPDFRNGIPSFNGVNCSTLARFSGEIQTGLEMLVSSAQWHYQRIHGFHNCVHSHLKQLGSTVNCININYSVARGPLPPKL